MKENKMGTKKISVLIWTMGLPMILSMVLQALYNVVDTMFVINMEEGGTLGNLALFAPSASPTRSSPLPRIITA